MTNLKSFFVKYLGIWFCKRINLPVGVDIFEDIKFKMGFDSANVIFDVGANIGQTVFLLKKAFPKSTIYSFEPIRSTFTELLQNVKEFQDVICKNLALGSKSEKRFIRIFDEKDSVLNSLNELAMNKKANAINESITVSTIDEFCADNDITFIDLLKIDTEGFEIQVLKGAQKMIAENRIKLIFCEVGLHASNFRNTIFSDINNYLTSHGFIFYALNNVVHFKNKPRNSFANALYVNESMLTKIDLSPNLWSEVG